MAKNFKSVEKNLEVWWGALGLPSRRMSRERFGEAVEDISCGPLSIEVKSRKTVPAYVKEWLDQAKANSDDKIPIVHWHQDRVHYGNDFVLMRASDLRLLVTAMYSMAENRIDGFSQDTATTIRDYLEAVYWAQEVEDTFQLVSVESNEEKSEQENPLDN